MRAAPPGRAASHTRCATCSGVIRTPSLRTDAALLRASGVDELLGICEELGIDTAAAPIASGAAALEVAADG